MKTVGEILRNAREKRAKTLDEVSRTTKIRVNFLEALEKNRFGQIGEATVVKGFIKNYAEYLELAPNDVLAVFRRDFIEDQRGQILPRGAYEPLNKTGFFWTPQMTIFLGAGILAALFFAYLSFQIFSFLGSPPLTVNFPPNGSQVKQSSVEIEGKTDSDATIYLNGEIVTVSSDGNFKKTISLSPGENKIKVEAISRRGKKTVKEVEIKYELPD